MEISFDNWILLEEAFLFTEVKKPKPPWRDPGSLLGKNPKTSKSDVLLGDEGAYKGGVNPLALRNSLAKSGGGSYDDFDSYLIHFMPSAQAGFITCPCASGGCASECLNTAGNMGSLGGKTVARLKRTWQMAKEAPLVVERIKKEIASKLAKAENNNKKLAIRLNGTSDFDWTKYKDKNGQTLFDIFPTVQFYDYTKVVDRVPKLQSQHPNYHLTFSRSETAKNQKEAKEMLNKGYNVAVVFGPGKTGGASELIFKPKVNPATIEDLKSKGIIPADYHYNGEKAGQALLPSIFDDHKVVDGDSHDLRFLEKTFGKTGLVIGLTAKGSSAYENFDLKKKEFSPEKSGFVVQPLDKSIIKHPANYDYIVQAMDYVNQRNTQQKTNRRNYASSKLLYSKKQAIINYIIFDDIEPLIKVAEDWAALQSPPIKLDSRKEKEDYAMALAAKEMPSISYKSPKLLKNELDMIAKHCEKHPEDCDKLYLNPVKKSFNTTAGGAQHTDVTGYNKPTYMLKMVDEPNKAMHPGLAALSRGNLEVT